MILPVMHRLLRSGQPQLRYATLFPSTHDADSSSPAARPRGAVLLTPGYLEHVGRYEHVMRLWAEAGFAVAVHDPRGQGESEGRRGHILHFSEFVDDAYAVLAALDELPQWRALGAPILAGHSMGGLISTRVAMANRRAFRGLGLMSPFFGVAFTPPPWKVWLGRSVSSFWPTFTEKTGLNTKVLTHDAEREAFILADPLSQQRVVTARWFTEMEASHAWVKQHFHELTLPIYCMASGDDQVADLRATQAIFATLPEGRGELEIAEGEYHELHQELAWRAHMSKFAEKFASWCEPS